jgi:hypothetical protein
MKNPFLYFKTSSEVIRLAVHHRKPTNFVTIPTEALRCNFIGSAERLPRSQSLGKLM